MANDDYPLESRAYSSLEEIGQGVNSTVYKAQCTKPQHSSNTTTPVAIKSINLDRVGANIENVRHEAKTMSFLSHRNILSAHCSFTVGGNLWVVTPFVSGGSLESILASSFPGGLSEPCIAVILKQVLMGLFYLHRKGLIHKGIKASNILIEGNDGSIFLADLGVSASVYESIHGWSFENTPNPHWIPLEVIQSRKWVSNSADIWSFGILALELAHGSFSRAQNSSAGVTDYKNSNEFKDMVEMCFDQDPLERPSAEKLLMHPFFNRCHGLDFLLTNVLHGLPPLEQRFREINLQRIRSISTSDKSSLESCSRKFKIEKLLHAVDVAKVLKKEILELEEELEFLKQF